MLLFPCTRFPIRDTDKGGPDGNKAGEIWAIALSADGQYLAATSIDGRINVWDNLGGSTKIREFETKGSFGMAIDLVSLELEWVVYLLI